jgi:hypothetical protein|tara:strand:- start:396 stop:560 length:165 start_codon:yes stop_codon:yes gene_type:complete
MTKDGRKGKVSLGSGFRVRITKCHGYEHREMRRRLFEAKFNARQRDAELVRVAL